MDANDIYCVSETVNGNEFATNMLAGYPGYVDFYNTMLPFQYSYLCTSPTGNVQDCNPRRISQMGSIRNQLPNGTQIGPETSVGARLYCSNPGAPDLHYKVISMGVPQRARQGKDVVIGIHDFMFEKNTRTVQSQGYRVVDKFIYDYFNDYQVYCITNEATDVHCMQQEGRLRNINAPYNDGTGYYTTEGRPNCPSKVLKTIMSVRSLETGVLKNEFWIFNPETEELEQRIDMPYPQLNLFPIGKMQTVGDRYFAMINGCVPAIGCIKRIFSFKIENGSIDPASIVWFSDPGISNINTFFVAGNTRRYYEAGDVFKVYVSYQDGTDHSQVGSFDVIAGNQYMQDIDFGPMTTYAYPPNNLDRIVDFAYVLKDEERTATTDLLMVGGKNLYIVQDEVPLRNVYNRPSSAKPATKGNQTLTVTPNPFTQAIQVKLQGIKAGNYTISVLDNMGKTVYSEATWFTNSQPRPLELPQNLNRGMYYIKVTGDHFIQSAKIIKQ